MATFTFEFMLDCFRRVFACETQAKFKYQRPQDNKPVLNPTTSEMSFAHSTIFDKMVAVVIDDLQKVNLQHPLVTEIMEYGELLQPQFHGSRDAARIKLRGNIERAILDYKIV